MKTARGGPAAVIVCAWSRQRAALPSLAMNALVLVAFLALAAADQVSFYKSCGSHLVGQIISLDINPCGSTGRECHFPIGQNSTLTITFTAHGEILTAKPYVYAYMFSLLKIPAPFHMETNSCNNFNIPCPIHAGQQVIYTTSVFVDPVFPAIRTTAEWQVHDQNNNVIFCFDVPVALEHSAIVG